MVESSLVEKMSEINDGTNLVGENYWR
jgi:hypothetical protein